MVKSSGLSNRVVPFIDPTIVAIRRISEISQWSTSGSAVVWMAR